MGTINIPVYIDEDLMNKTIQQDYENKIFNQLYSDVKKALEDRCGHYGYRKSHKEGIICIAEEAVDHILEENNDLIIQAAADKLAERLAKTKKAKELLDSDSEAISSK